MPQESGVPGRVPASTRAVPANPRTHARVHRGMDSLSGSGHFRSAIALRRRRVCVRRGVRGHGAGVVAVTEQILLAAHT
jgi:hypothetical protein